MSHNPSLLESIFFSALEKKSPDERSAFLDEACEGNSELRHSVERMLAAQAGVGSFLESPAAVATLIALPTAEAPGTQIGPYKLLEQIGAGGMGTVYVAEQKVPVRRTVALKVIKPGMDTREVIARFEAERQALAMMNHPNIAKVLDAGSTVAGRPYFVMELVKGVPITEFCDEHKLDTRERLKLFTTLCQAVQHAHQKGLIHRDIKPSNLLVEMHDVTPVPKVIDFGVAKAIGHALTEKTLHTGFSQLVGTPLYMSPEQAGQSSIDVDTRSDVYSLGVLLYEVLTGHTPFESETLRKAGLDEMRRIIREVDPPLPSARVSTLNAQALSTVSERRKVEPHKLGQQLRGELDWIVMKALEKDRTRRYESASALAADVQRFLNDEPVLACPPSALYRLRKFARRRRGLLTTAVLLALTVFTGTAVSVWQAVEATKARKFADEQRQEADERRNDADRNFALAYERLESEQQARLEADTQRNDAQAQRAAADEQRQLAETNFQKAREAVDRMLLRVGDASLKDVPQAIQLRKKILDDALEFYEGFMRERPDDLDLRRAAAKAYGTLDDAEWVFGEPVERAKMDARIRELLGDLHAKQPDDLQIRKDYALSLAHSRDEYPIRRAIEILSPVAEQKSVAQFLAYAHEMLGQVLSKQGRLEQSEAELKAAIALCDPTLRRPGFMLQIIAEASTLLADLLAKKGQRAEAVETMRRAVAAREALINAATKVQDRMIRAGDLSKLAGLLEKDDRHSEAIDEFRHSAEAWRDLVREFPTVRNYADSWVRSRASLIEALRRAGRIEEAHEVVSSIHPRTVDEYADRLMLHGLLKEPLALAEADRRETFQFLLAVNEKDLTDNMIEALAELGLVFLRQQRPNDPEFISLLNRLAEAIELKLQNTDPKDPATALADWASLARLRTIAGDMPAAQAAVAQVRQLSDRTKESKSAIRLAEWFDRLGKPLFELGRYTDALAVFEQSVELDAKQQINPGAIGYEALASCPDEGFRLGITNVLDRVVEAMKDNSGAHVARAHLHTTLRHFREADRDYTHATELDSKNWRIYNWRGLMRKKAGRSEQAIEDFGQAIECNPAAWEPYCNRAQTWREAKEYDKAQADYAKAIELNPREENAYIGRAEMCRHLHQYEQADADYTNLIELNPKDPRPYNERGEMRRALKQSDKAEADYSRAIELDPTFAPPYNNRALIWDARGQPEKALADYAKAIELLPGQSVYYFNRAVTWCSLEKYDNALADSGRAIELAPRDASAFILRGDIRAEMQRYHEALDDYTKAIDLDGPEAEPCIRRGQLFVKLGQWGRARDDFEKAKARAANPYASYLHALTCLVMQDEPAYQAACAEMLRRFRASRDPEELYFSAWTCVLAPDGISEMGALLDLTSRSVEIEKASPKTLEIHAAALYRAGRYDDALVPLHRMTAAPANPKTPPVYAWYFLAMTHARLRHTPEAREWLDKALAETERILSKVEGPDAPPWNRRLTHEMLRSEASKLVKGE